MASDATTQPDVPRSPLSFIEAGHWEHALFTTYALNLAYFESHVLTRLHRQSCNDVVVLADAKRYAESTMEACAEHVGTAYQLIPVELEEGAFHAKLTYLVGADYDLLLVGSGNLTPPGHGHNQLECLEAFDSRERPDVFSQLAEALELVGEARQVRASDGAVSLKQFVRRAARHRVQGAASRPVATSAVLLNSLQRPILDQLLERIRGEGPYESMHVLSPFHDPQARPLTRVARALGISRVHIALAASDESTPVSRTGEDVAFVRKVPVDHPPAHAKWYEFKGQRCWLMHGSANATHTALETTNNFEVVVLREVPAQQLSAWTPAVPKRVIPPEEASADDAVVLALSVRLGVNGDLRGTFLNPIDTDGSWEGRLLISSRPVPLGPVDVRSGVFELPLAPDLRPTGLDPVVLQLTRSQQQAVGWVMQQTQLALSSEYRSHLRRLAQLGSGEVGFGEYLGIISWLTDRIAQLPAAPTGPKPPAATGDEPEEVPRGPFDYDEYADADEQGPTRRHGLEQIAATLGALAAFRASETTAGADTDFNQGADGDGSDGIRGLDREYSDSEWEEDTEVDALERLASQCRHQLDRKALDAKGIETFLEALLWTELCLRRKAGRLTSAAPLAQWLPYAIRWLRHGGATPRTRAVALAAAAVAWAVLAEGEEVRKSDVALLARAANPVDLEAASQMVEEAFRDSASLNTIDPRTRRDALAALPNVLSHRGFGARLSQFLCDWKYDRKLVPPTELVSLTGPRLLELCRDRHGAAPYAEVNATQATSCPVCHAATDSSDRTELRHRRVIRCRGCSRFLVWLKDDV
jgi:hypothetical protein